LLENCFREIGLLCIFGVFGDFGFKLIVSWAEGL